jgi:hypothetical protein
VATKVVSFRRVWSLKTGQNSDIEKGHLNRWIQVVKDCRNIDPAIPDMPDFCDLSMDLGRGRRLKCGFGYGENKEWFWESSSVATVRGC